MFARSPFPKMVNDGRPGRPWSAFTDMPGDETSQGRAVLRLTGDYFLRWADLASDLFDGDHLRALVLNTILHLNVHGVHEDTVLNLRYAGQEPPPDSARRPVTVSEAARAMAMPRVTAGRYIKTLVGTGSIVAVGRGGYIVPSRQILNPPSLAMTDPLYSNLLQLIRRLRSQGLLPGDTDGGRCGRDQRYRLVLRANGEFVGDWIRPWNRHYPTGYLFGLVFSVILQANDRARIEAGYELADGAKTPISAHAIATSLKLPAETVRRHILRLESDGVVLRTGAGLIVPAAVWTTPLGRELLANAADSVARLNRMLLDTEVSLTG